MSFSKEAMLADGWKEAVLSKLPDGTEGVKMKLADGTEATFTFWEKNTLTITNGTHACTDYYTDKDGVTHCWDLNRGCERTFILDDDEDEPPAKQA